MILASMRHSPSDDGRSVHDGTCTQGERATFSCPVQVLEDQTRHDCRSTLQSDIVFMPEATSHVGR